ncbi:MAG: hypothetical protein AVDCRST_MAG80-867 [uncultured Rubrobacteraceae bacterium]|uniref:Uncharacterized protein n=1 Tax=uncultured Rubrobacteraceae bacterium TaxID=349277 RepID=A0A6J4Q6D9_9ACTN|nr:MAG: hypothetical protein AVDCRST_MAG80-867 [uncultured Rubrobacteraceae bacterium]
MYARVTTIQGAPGKMDDAKGHIQEHASARCAILP